MGDGVAFEFEVPLPFEQTRASPPLTAFALAQMPLQLPSVQERPHTRLPSGSTHTVPPGH